MRVDRDNVDNLLDLTPNNEVNVSLDTTDLSEDAVLNIINDLSEKGLVYEVWHNHPDLDFTVHRDGLEEMRWVVIHAINDEATLAGACASNYNPEVYEWWVVDSFFAHQLQQRGKVVLDGQFWGRQCTGQAIFLDCVIGEIYDALQKRVSGEK